jgi:hypothetical protein
MLSRLTVGTKSAAAWPQGTGAAGLVPIDVEVFHAARNLVAAHQRRSRARAFSAT